MTPDEAIELVEFINRYNGRYKATPLPAGVNETWVLLADRETGGNPAPVVDVKDYLHHFDDPPTEPPQRGRRYEEQLPEGREILRAYLARNDHDPAKLKELNDPDAPKGLEQVGVNP